MYIHIYINTCIHAQSPIAMVSAPIFTAPTGAMRGCVYIRFRGPSRGLSYRVSKACRIYGLGFRVQGLGGGGGLGIRD